MQTQKAKAELFKELHHNGKILILPNIWDALGASLLEKLDYPAIATATKEIAEKLRNFEAMEEVTGNEITTDILKSLLHKKLDK